MLNSYLCTKTYQTYLKNVPREECSFDKTHKGHLAFPIDDLLVYPLTNFWKIGIKTQSCCSGHLHRESIPHVSFWSPSKEKKILEKLYRIAKGLEKENIVTKTRIVGKAKMYKLNMNNPITKKFRDFYWETTKQHIHSKVKEKELTVKH